MDSETARLESGAEKSGGNSSSSQDESFFKGSAHPWACFFHLLFKGMAMVCAIDVQQASKQASKEERKRGMGVSVCRSMLLGGRFSFHPFFLCVLALRCALRL